GSNIRVTNIEPGIAKTEFSLVRFKGDSAKSDAVYDGTKYLTGDDIARIIVDLSKLPAHVNINSLEVMATTQSWAGFAFER
ncbi:MAG: NAD(P)-dependent oxidoreductase, partial [Campylobacter sp.]|nr:NAD(P)-dependent oxidoreductase [Campylobacter sp.]